MAFSNGSDPLGGGGLHRPMADINVTPLVDVMLVLLIVFMVTAPMLATGLRVDLPQTKSAQPINPKQPLVISVTADGVIAVGTDTVALPALVSTLLKLTEGDTTRLIQIRADKTAPYGAIIGVIDELSANGLVHVALVSDPKSHAPAAAAPTAPTPVAVVPANAEK